MTIAACFNCGASKFGALTTCRDCGARPLSDHDIMLSLVLTTQPSGVEALRKRADAIRSGRKVCLEREPSAEWIQAIAKYRKMIGDYATCHQTDSKFKGKRFSNDSRKVAADSGVWSVKSLGIWLGLTSLRSTIGIYAALVAFNILALPSMSN